jgi:hypothetical protein
LTCPGLWDWGQLGGGNKWARRCLIRPSSMSRQGYSGYLGPVACVDQPTTRRQKIAGNSFGNPAAANRGIAAESCLAHRSAQCLRRGISLQREFHKLPLRRQGTKMASICRWLTLRIGDREDLIYRHDPTGAPV